MSTTVGPVAVPPFLNVFDGEFDFASPEVARAQAQSWYADSPIGPLVLRYAEAQELLRDPRLMQNGRAYLEMNGIFDGPIYDWFVPMILHLDGDDHRRIRGLIHKAFTPRMVNSVRPFIRTVAERLADRLTATRECEFVEDFATALPLAVMCRLLGVPNEDADRFLAWTTDIGFVFTLAQSSDTPARVEAAVVGLKEYFDSLIADKKAVPADDLISALIAAQRAESVSEQELSNLVVTLVFAALDTTRQQLANAMFVFSEHHDQWTLLARRPELGKQAVDEVMRWLPTAHTLNRFAMVDFEFRGLQVAAGTLLTMCIAAAQRDPLVFGDGNRFDIAVARQAPPLQFGAGPHYCVGAALARAEVGESLTVLTSRLGPPSVAGTVPWRPPVGISGPAALPLRFE